MIKKKKLLFAIILILLVVASVVSIGVGRFNIPPNVVLNMILKKITQGDMRAYSSNMQTVVFKLRIPRIMADAIVGASLAVAGVVYQAIFRNKLVSADILGVSNGASVGAALAMIIGLSGIGMQSLACAVGIATVILSVLLSKAFSGGSKIGLALSGMVVGGLMSSLLSLIKYVADVDSKLPEIVYWLMGSMSKVTITDVKGIILPCGVSLFIIVILSWKINILSMGENEAKTLGVNVTLLKAICIICSTMLTVCSVCVCGVIGWFGLMVPHISRLLVGDDNRVLFPVSAIIGATLLVILDTLSRTIFVSEIPLGILTGITGTIVFGILVFAGRKKNEIGS